MCHTVELCLCDGLVRRCTHCLMPLVWDLRSGGVGATTPGVCWLHCDRRTHSSLTCLWNPCACACACACLHHQQVHKARLRTFRRDQLRHLTRREGGASSTLTVWAGDTAWDICNSHGISLAELAASNRCVWWRCLCACVEGRCWCVYAGVYMLGCGWGVL
jgi:hypothetical protein